MDGSPFSVDDTRFTIHKKLASSCGLPIWFDEYKPSDLSADDVDWFHNILRKVSKGHLIPKGRPGLGEITLEARAPVVISGEQSVSDPAVRRRTIMTQFTRKGKEGATASSTPNSRVRRVTRAKTARSTSPTGSTSRSTRWRTTSITRHALAYYQYVTERDPADHRALWYEAADRTAEIEKALGATPDDTESQGLQTIVFGTLVFRDFADRLGVSTAELHGGSEIHSAVEHAVANIGPDGRRKEHIDEFVELLSQAALSDYVERDTHYRVIDSQKFGCEVLAFHMPSCYDEVRKYVRDYNIEEVYSLIGKNDYLHNFKDKSDLAGSYALDTNRRTKGIANGQRAVYLDLDRARQAPGSDAVDIPVFQPV